MIYAYRSETGLRQCNEDCCYTPENGAKPLVIVADGMGGHRAGNVASLLAIESIVSFVENGESHTKQQLLQRAVQSANHRIFDIAHKEEDCMGMGTTAVLAYIEPNKFTFANVGDSRLYHYNGSRIRRLTRDHSFVELLVQSGNITDQQAKTHPQRNILTKAVGTSQFVKADTGVCAWQKNDIIALCSDGLHGSIDERDFEFILANSNNLLHACDRLTDLALANGSRDNITVVLVKNTAGEGL